MNETDRMTAREVALFEAIRWPMGEGAKSSAHHNQLLLDFIRRVDRIERENENLRRQLATIARWCKSQGALFIFAEDIADDAITPDKVV